MLSVTMKLWKEEAGQGMAEYSLILGIIAFAVIAVLTLVKVSLVQVYYMQAADAISEALGL